MVLRQRRERRTLVIAAALLWAGCTDNPDPPVSFVVGLRVLAISAEPPQVSPGGVTQVTALVVDTTGRPVEVRWSRCTTAPLTGESVNQDCVTAETGPNLEPLGTGLSIAFTMPQVAPGSLGEPDSTNGVYVPLVARVTDGADAVTAVYRLRLGDNQPPNMNPTIATVDVVDAAGVAVALDPATPRVVHAGDELTLQDTYAPGSDQTYLGIANKSMTETLTTSWFSTAGELTVQRTSASQPRTVLRLTGKTLPNAGENIDLYAVAHDERGGVGYTHRALELQ